MFKIIASFFVILLFCKFETTKVEELGLPIRIDKRNNLNALSVSNFKIFLKGLKIIKIILIALEDISNEEII